MAKKKTKNLTVEQLIKQLEKFPKTYEIDIPFFDMEDGEVYGSPMLEAIADKKAKTVGLVSLMVADMIVMQDQELCDDHMCPDCRAEMQEEKTDKNDIN